LVFLSPDGPQRNEDRRTIVAVLAGSTLAVLVNLISTVAPFRPRPVHDPSYGWIPPQIVLDLKLDNWSVSERHRELFRRARLRTLVSVAPGRTHCLIIHGFAGTVATGLFRVSLPWRYRGRRIDRDRSGVVVAALRRTGARRSHAHCGATPARLFYALFFFLSYEIGLVFENNRRLASGLAKDLAKGGAAGLGMGMIWRAWSQGRAESRDVP
jgi:hypothetical protein